MNANAPDTFLTQQEVCQLLRISRKTLQEWRRRGRIKFYRFGHRTIRFRHSAVLALIEKTTQQN